MSDTEHSQFHLFEVAVQKRLGIDKLVAQKSQGFIRAVMPEQHRKFFSELTFVMIGVTDNQGYPWPIPMLGQGGFIQTPNNTTLHFTELPNLLSSLGLQLIIGQKVGLLGIQLSTKRRNRINGTIQMINDQSFSVQVEQSFGNCPKYIQKRELIRTANHQLPDHLFENISKVMDDKTKVLIENADTFFISSRTRDFNKDKRSGIDTSHRGGKLGFVKIVNNKVKFPDYRGNGFFNTLGNIESDNRVGLFFPDFLTGNGVFITGTACILWDKKALKGFEAAERIIEVEVKQSIYLPALWQ
jgi:predicted pyridoxine 5'-phosphate oxidase superfamily flavin-nucleotide-binding protein